MMVLGINYSNESILGVRDVYNEKLPAKYLIFIKLLAQNLYKFEDKKPFVRRLSFSLVLLIIVIVCDYQVIVFCVPDSISCKLFFKF